MPAPLLITKLFIPHPGKNLVIRPRLLQKLDESQLPDFRLTLLSAPAGFGKTTLVSTWVTGLKSTEDGHSPSVAWLSLEEGENDPIVFWSYVVTAIHAQKRDVGNRALTLLRASQPPSLEIILSLLVNDLVDIQDDLILVLDDFHFIRTPSILQSLSFLVDHLPPKFHLLLLSRTDPALPLALLRSRGQLMEIRLVDLRFSNEEAATYLNECMQLSLPDMAVNILNAKTEGWAAGIQMAGISLLGREDPTQFVQTFSGSNRYILDYLVDEILDRQPAEVQTFLLYTSILEQMCASLCDAVFEGSGNARVLLDQLERANLFLVPLDRERNWYRYHHLFADILRLKLTHSSPEMIPVLQKQAAKWFETKGMLSEAVYYFHIAKDDDALARLTEQNALSLIKKGNSADLRKWIRLLPQTIIENRPWLCILLAWSHISQAEQAESEPWLQQAEALLHQTNQNEQSVEMLGILYSLRTEVLHSRGDIAGTIEMGRKALALLNPSNLTNRGFVYYSLGRAYYASGDLDHALEIWSEFISIHQNDGINNMYAPIMSMSCYILTIQGRLRAAIDLNQQAIDFMLSQDIERFTAAGNPYNGLGMAAYQKNQLDEAEKLITKGLEQNRISGNLNSISVCLSYRAHVYIAKGEVGNAWADLLEVERIEQKYRPYFDTRSISLACRVHFHLEKGDIHAAVSLIEKSGLHSYDSLNFQQELDHISLARVLIAQGNFDEAGNVLQRLADASQAGGRFGRLIEILNLRAIALHAQGKTTEALQALEYSLGLAEPEGYIRVFLDMRESMEQLLSLTVQKGLHREFASRLLAAFPAFAPPSSAAINDQKNNLFLVEPLSRRELEVLQLIETGLSNKEIALKLYISMRTVKYHTTNIFRKLEVDRRAQAIIKAKEVGLFH